jgi:hypothetical protein
LVDARTTFASVTYPGSRLILWCTAVPLATENRVSILFVKCFTLERMRIDQTLEENKITEDARTHFFTIVIGDIPPYSFTLMIDRAVFCAEKFGADIEKSDFG